MKTKYFFVYTSMLISTLFFLACSSEDDSLTISIPTVNYASTTIEATFFEEGSTAPSVNWNGEQGSFSLAGSTEGLTINATTGVLSWSKLLAPDSHNLQIIAANSAGQTTITIILINPLQGVFTKIYPSTDSIEIEFKRDNTMFYRQITSFDTVVSPGTYTINNNIIVAELIEDDGSISSFSLSGTLTQSISLATYTADLLYGEINYVAASFEVTMN